MRIKYAGYVENGGQLFNKMVLTCRKKDCPNYEKDVETKYNSLNVVEDPNAH